MKTFSFARISSFVFCLLILLLAAAAPSSAQTLSAKEKPAETAREKNSPAPVEKSAPEKNADAAQTEQPAAPLPPMQEGERLTFMQKDEAVERSQPESGSLLLKTLGAMCLIVGLIFFGAWGLKKLGFAGVIAAGSAKQNAPELQILSSVAPKNGQTISVVKFGERILVVGSTAQTFTLLAEETLAPEDSAADRAGEESGEFQALPVTPRSVAELLAEEEEISFENELEKAENKMTFPKIFGGQI